MSTQRRESKGRRGARGRVFLLEHLEDRRLLAAATEAFTGPSLSGLITQAFHGKDTAEATIKTMLSALQTQLTEWAACRPEFRRRGRQRIRLGGTEPGRELQPER